MKIYSTLNTFDLLFDARNLLVKEVTEAGLSESVVPWFRMETPRLRRGSLRIGTSTIPEWWGSDVRIYAMSNQMHSPHRQQGYSSWCGDPEEYSATWDQWGALLGAMYDAAEERGAQVKASAYDNTARGGDSRFETSAEMFHYMTAGDFRRVNRSTVLDGSRCLQHKWGWVGNDEGLACQKCEAVRHD